MLQIEGQQSITVNGRKFTAWRDDRELNKYYVLPQAPQLRVVNNKPVFQFLMYRSPIERGEEGKKGGLCTFDVEMSISESDRTAIKDQLLLQAQVQAEKRARDLEKLVITYEKDKDNPQGEWRIAARRLGLTPVEVKGLAEQYNASTLTDNKWQIFKQPVGEIQFGDIAYTKGSVSLNLSKLGGELVEQVWSNGRPSLFGDNIATFTAELSQDGAALFWDALRNGQGGTIQLAYELWFSAMLPPVEVKVSFYSEKFKSFVQETDSGIGTAWGTKQTETIKEQWRDSGCSKVDVYIPITFSSEQPDEAKALEERLREWGYQRLNDIIARQIQPDFDKVGNRFATAGGGFLRGSKRDDTLSAISDVEESFKEMSAIEYYIAPQGTLQTLKSLTDASGNPLIPDDKALDDYFRQVDLNPTFFQELDIGVNVNASFANLGLFDVQVKVDYPGAQPQELRFTDNTEKKYRAYVSTDPASGQVINDYMYSYEINYKGKSQKFRSDPIKTNETVLTIGVDDVGMFLANGYATGVNFAYVDRAQVSLRYNDAERGVRVSERQFIVDSANPTFSVKEPIFVPRDQPYEYMVRYFMSDGSEFVEDWKPYDSREFYLNDPFTATQQYLITAVGVMKTIDAIFLDLTYTEDGTAYRQSKRVTFTPTKRSETWSVPAINPAKGKVTYSGFIQYLNGNTSEIPSTETTSRDIKVGNVREDMMEVVVSAEKLDFEHRLTSAKINFQYGAIPSDSQRKSFSFRDEDEDVWMIDLKDKNDRDYEWQATVLMQEKMFGEAGKVYLPGPTKNDWATESTTLFNLADYMPSDEELAKRNNLLLVKISKKTIDWGEVETIRLKIQHGKTIQTYRIAEGEGDSDPDLMFLAPLVQPGTYKWQLQMYMDDGERVYYPNSETMAESGDSELFLNDYVPERYNGNLIEA